MLFVKEIFLLLVSSLLVHQWKSSSKGMPRTQKPLNFNTCYSIISWHKLPNIRDFTRKTDAKVYLAKKPQ